MQILAVSLPIAPSPRIPVSYTHLEVIATRFSDVMWLIEQIMWKSLDKRVAMDRGILLVCVENTYEGDIREAKGRLLTGKHDRVNHGIGLDNVKRIAGKYSGEVRFSYEEGRFRADVLLYIS